MSQGKEWFGGKAYYFLVCLNSLARPGPVCLLWLLLTLCLLAHPLFPPAPSGRNSTSRSLVTERCHTGSVTGTEWRVEWPLSLHTLLGRLQW